MSQEKVNKYKEEKANRKSIMKKEKRNKLIARIIGTVVCVAIVGWIGYSIYDSSVTKLKTSQTEVDMTAVNDYLTGLNADAAADGTAEE